MFPQLLFHLTESKILPLPRNCLLAGVRPPVAVVEIDHHSHTVVSGPFGHLKHGLSSRPSATWIQPHTQPDGIEPQLMHQSRIFANLSLGVIEFSTLGLQLRRSADIGSEPEGIAVLSIACCRQHHGGNHHQYLFHTYFFGYPIWLLIIKS